MINLAEGIAGGPAETLLPVGRLRLDAPGLEPGQQLGLELGPELAHALALGDDAVKIVVLINGLSPPTLA